MPMQQLAWLVGGSASLAQLHRFDIEDDEIADENGNKPDYLCDHWRFDVTPSASNQQLGMSDAMHTVAKILSLGECWMVRLQCKPAETMDATPLLRALEPWKVLITAAACKCQNRFG